MPRPATKKELLIQATQQFDNLFSLINSMPLAEQTNNFTFKVTEKDKEAHWKRDKNVRDALIHLYEWHLLMIDYINNNKSNNKNIPFLPSPYSWKSYGDMNIKFFEKHQSTSLDDAKQMLMNSHNEVISLIEKFSNEELFTKAYYNWSGTTSVGAYFVSATCSHYEWAIKKIKRQLKEKK